MVNNYYLIYITKLIHLFKTIKSHTIREFGFKIKI